MQKMGFYLLTDASILCSYLTSRWWTRFEKHPEFRGVVVREKRPDVSILQARHAFHARYAGQHKLSADQWKELIELYPKISEAEQATIQAIVNTHGLCSDAVSHHPDTIFLDDDVNSETARQWLQSITQTASLPWLFSCIGQLFKPQWVDTLPGCLVNSHTAVLPYARGIYTIENIAATQDIVAFRQAAGFTIHYIDAQVDTGSIIRAERVVDPFRFKTLWDLKAYLYMSSFDCYINTAEVTLKCPETVPAGIIPDPALRGKNFKSKDFSAAKRHGAETGYLAMKEIVQLSACSVP
ncbi:hypothetical protein D0962_30120 [Leptolyngbyaceae cyanobacterium CCMR0082]|uniref:Formyl transferase N-terminal domain-containing protein n=1 Tax=Adonisia turfae CCMR0082 TaxID=2304604 RepID=A0A6M0SG81_9CYAN|nr:formyltransferase family protein [Adonisia turfae]NEZ66963.1 hypothetical protein [Adonisia turfae CCMR0082]